MIDRLRRGFNNAAVGPAVVLWGFGYFLVDIFAYLLGRQALGIGFVTSLPLFALGVTYTVFLDRLRQRLSEQPPALRMTVMTVTVFAVTIVHCLTDLYWLRWLALTIAPGWQTWALEIGKQRIFTVGLLYLWTFSLALTLLWATRVGHAAQKNAERATAFEAASHRAEAAALRLQLNPHFLFNTLNSISSLVTLDRKDDAEEMIGQLSDFLRASLISDPMADVSLGEEIATIESYLSIESARFGERMNVDIAVPDALLDLKVPNFILQPLVENAVKHGVALSRSPTTIAITAEKHQGGLVLSVINRTPQASPKEKPDPVRRSTGIGITNIRQRLEIAFGKAAKLKTTELLDGYSTVITMPLPSGRIKIAHT